MTSAMVSQASASPPPQSSSSLLPLSHRSSRSSSSSSSTSPAPSPAPSENDVDVAREEAAIEAAISQSQQQDDDDDDDVDGQPGMPRDGDERKEDGENGAQAEQVEAAPAAPVVKKKRGGNMRPPPPDPSIARATGAKLLDELLAKAAAYMSRTTVGAELAAGAGVGGGGGRLGGGAATSGSSRTAKKGGKGRMSEKEEDDVLLHSLQDEADQSSMTSFPPLTEQPSSITGKMRGYQLEGLNWMIRLYDSGVSGILADEMGLGKTLQSISLLAYLKQVRRVNGPHLVLTPLSTLGNWHREFTRWCPDLRVCRFHGNKEERAEMVARGDLRMDNFDVLLTSYEMAIIEKTVINKIRWCFIVVDEAHRLKNENSLLSVIVRYFSSQYRLLLTGTPLQNNLHELWALLNFLLPDLFSSAGDFDAIFQDAETDSDSDRGAVLLQSLHRLLRPFMLRRLKTQVEQDLPPKKISLIYTGLSEIQRRLYKQVLEKDVDALLGSVKERRRLMNLVMQLRKVADHPYLFEGIEEPDAPLHGDHLVRTCGKMILLDRLLVHLRQRGSRVLIFSQMTRMLDILEDFMVWRQYTYCRIDGNTAQADREEHMRVFNEEGSVKFVFLLSTRAGGLGINLSTADTVILYDSDWNPQMDLQAMDRAHRIGQRRQVTVLRLICEDTVEVQMLKRAEIKLHLDAMVIQQGRLQSGAKGAAAGSGGSKSGGMTTEDLTKMIRYGADKIFRQTESSVSDEDIINILERGEQQAKEMDSSLKQHVNLMDLTFDGRQPEDVSLLPDDPNSLNLTPEELEIHRVTMVADALGKRQRKANYNEDAYYKEALKVGGRPVRTLLTKPFRLPRMSEHQFFNRRRIVELSEKEQRFYYRHYHSAQPPAVRGLSEEEVQEMERLLKEGYEDWSYNDYQRFLQACRRYGRQQIDKIAAAMQGRKTKEQVVAYHSAFFQRVGELKGGAALMQRIERAEKRVAAYAEMEELLDRSLSPFPTRRSVLSSFPLRYLTLKSDKGYSLEEDRYLLWLCREVGFGEWRRMLRRIEKDDEFGFDHFLVSRSAADMERRVAALLREIQRANDPDYNKRRTASKKAAAAALAEQRQEQDKKQAAAVTGKRKSDSNGSSSQKSSKKKK